MLRDVIIRIIELYKGEKVMLDEFFFSNVLENPKNSRLLEELKKFSEGQLKQVYVIDKPLGERKYEYEYKDSVVVLIPKYKILFINFGDDCDEFEDYIKRILLRI